MRKQLLVIFLVYLMVGVTPSWAAIQAATSWEVWPTVGSSTNGAGFSIGLGTAATGTDMTTDVTGLIICSSSHGTFASDALKYIKITAGTGATQGFYQITTVTTNGCSAGVSSATVDRSIGSSLTSVSYSLFPGIDRTQQSGAAVTIDGTIVAATCNTNTITFSGGSSPYSPGSNHNDDGNAVHLATGQTNVTAGWYEITNSTSTTWTLTGPANACTAAANTLASASNKMGGAADLPESVAGAVIGSNVVFVNESKGIWTTGGATLSSNSTITNASSRARLVGYTSTRNDGAPTKVKVQPNATALTALTVSGQGWDISGFQFDGSGANTLGTCLSVSGNNSIIYNIKCNNFTSAGLNITGAETHIFNVEVTASQSGATGAVKFGAGSASSSISDSNIHDNANSPGIVEASGIGMVTMVNNFIQNNATEGIQFDVGAQIFHNTIDTNVIGIVGVANNSDKFTVIKGNLLSNNTTAGLEIWTSAGYGTTKLRDGNCYYNNGTNILNSLDEGSSTTANGIWPVRNSLDITLGSSPYVSGTFSLVPGSGAVQGGQPSALPARTETSYISCGAIQPNTAGGGSAYVQ